MQLANACEQPKQAMLVEEELWLCRTLLTTPSGATENSTNSCSIFYEFS